jgi:hypothetical protein
MVLQAYVDDSGSDGEGKYFVLAGFIAPANKWAEFSDIWNQTLKKFPGADYFKMVEAYHLHGEFDRRKGWTEELRDQRIDELVSVIKTYAYIKISASISHAEFQKTMRDRPVPIRRYATDFPYILLAERIILRTCRLSEKLALSEPCDFIFDTQDGISKEMKLWWPSFQKLLEKRLGQSVTKYLGREPIFVDEKEFIPLQAADLLAWNLRRSLDRPVDHNDRVGRVLGELVFEKIVHVNFSEHEMSIIEAAMNEGEAKFIKDNPGFPLVHLAANKSLRKKARKEPNIPT